MSVGSQFKVLVLARAAEKLASGERKAEQRMAISPWTRSFPSGILQDFDPGLSPTINDHLSFMISQSDNTATDTLLRAVGRYIRVDYSRQVEMSHKLDWHFTAAELASFYGRVSQGAFETPEISGIVAHYLTKGGAGMIGAIVQSDSRVSGVARKGGSDAGILTDGGFVTLKDGRHVVLAVLANRLPPGATTAAIAPKISNLSHLLFQDIEARSGLR